VADILTDAEIARLIALPKQLPQNHELLFKPKPKRGHKESELSVAMEDGSKFVVMVRVAEDNPLDFSAILAFDSPNRSKRAILRRYNGKSHEHKNTIELVGLPYDFHIHSITERYQGKKGVRADGFAETTDRYGDVDMALECLLKDCNFIAPEENKHLFSDPTPGDE